MESEEDNKLVNIRKRNRLTENKLVISRGDEEGEWGEVGVRF